MSQNSKIFLTDPLGHTLYDQHALPFALILLVMDGAIRNYEVIYDDRNKIQKIIYMKKI